MYTVWEKRINLLVLKPGGTYSNHWTDFRVLNKVNLFPCDLRRNTVSLLVHLLASCCVVCVCVCRPRKLNELQRFYLNPESTLFKSRSGHKPSLLRFLVFPNSLQGIQGRYLKYRHDLLLQHPLQSIIHCHSTIQHYTVLGY